LASKEFRTMFLKTAAKTNISLWWLLVVCTLTLNIVPS
jgi:hypothetical protein